GSLLRLVLGGLLLSQGSLTRCFGLLLLARRFLRGLLRFLLHLLRFCLGLLGLKACLFGLQACLFRLQAALGFGHGIGASFGFAFYGSLLFRGDFGLRILFGLLLDGHHAGFLGCLRGFARGGIDQLA